MKKLLLSLSSAFAVLTVTTSIMIMTITTSCKKDETVTPVTTPIVVVTVPAVVSVTSTTITLNNQLSIINTYYSLSGKTFVGVNTAFDIAYGNNSASDNLFFVGGPNDESVDLAFLTNYTTTSTNFFNVNSSFTSSSFDTLVNVKAIGNLFTSSISGTSASTTFTNTRIKSSTAFAVGKIFAFQTSSGTKVLAKVTSAATGSTSAAGSISLQLKY